jgi:hypothetical protein
MEPVSDRPAAARSDRGERAGSGRRDTTRPNGNGHGNERAIGARPPAQDATVQAENGARAGGSTPTSCTSAQLRRFIKSRPYVPMHELRRRFELNGGSDEVSAISTPQGIVYVGLPGRESQFIADLVRQGDVGLELCRDPFTPMVVGVYPMRPITRQ